MPTPSYKYNEWMGRKDRMKYTPRDPRKGDKGKEYCTERFFTLILYPPLYRMKTEY